MPESTDTQAPDTVADAAQLDAGQLSGVIEDVAAISDGIADISGNVSALSEASGGASSLASKCAIAGYPRLDCKSANADGTYSLSLCTTYVSSFPSGYVNNATGIRIKPPYGGTISPGSNVLVTLNADGSVNSFEYDPLTIAYMQVQYSDDSSCFYSESHTLSDLTREYQQAHFPELFQTAAVAAPDAVLTREETLQGMGDFGFIGIVIVAVLLLNLGANLFQLFRSR